MGHGMSPVFERIIAENTAERKVKDAKSRPLTYSKFTHSIDKTENKVYSEIKAEVQVTVTSILNAFMSVQVRPPCLRCSPTGRTERTENTVSEFLCFYYKKMGRSVCLKRHLLRPFSFKAYVILLSRKTRGRFFCLDITAVRHGDGSLMTPIFWMCSGIFVRIL